MDLNKDVKRLSQLNHIRKKKNIPEAEKRRLDLEIIKWNCHNYMTALTFPFKRQQPVFKSYEQERKELRVSLP